MADMVAAQLRWGDVAGATHTAQLIDRPEEQGQALQVIGEWTTKTAGTFRTTAVPTPHRG